MVAGANDLRMLADLTIPVLHLVKQMIRHIVRYTYLNLGKGVKDESSSSNTISHDYFFLQWVHVIYKLMAADIA